MHKMVLVDTNGNPLDVGTIISCEEFDKIILASGVWHYIEEFIIDAAMKGLNMTHSRGKSKLTVAEGLVEVADFAHPEFSWAQIHIQIGNDDWVSAAGYAKRHPEDKPDLELGLTLAYGRAFDNLSRKLLKRANGLVKHRDDMKEKKTTALKAKELPAAKETTKKAKGSKK